MSSSDFSRLSEKLSGKFLEGTWGTKIVERLARWKDCLMSNRGLKTASVRSFWMWRLLLQKGVEQNT